MKLQVCWLGSECSGGLSTQFPQVNGTEVSVGLRLGPAPGLGARAAPAHPPLLPTCKSSSRQTNKASEATWAGGRRQRGFQWSAALEFVRGCEGQTPHCCRGFGGGVEDWKEASSES